MNVTQKTLQGPRLYLTFLGICPTGGPGVADVLGSDMGIAGWKTKLFSEANFLYSCDLTLPWCAEFLIYMTLGKSEIENVLLKQECSVAY